MYIFSILEPLGLVVCSVIFAKEQRMMDMYPVAVMPMYCWFFAVKHTCFNV
jgi:hypothetical protein